MNFLIEDPDDRGISKLDNTQEDFKKQKLCPICGHEMEWSKIFCLECLWTSPN